MNNFEKWHNKYITIEQVDLKNELEQEEKNIIEKLGQNLRDKIYTGRELEILYLNLLEYYIDDDMSEEEIKEKKTLVNDVDRSKFNSLLKKLEFLMYEKYKIANI